MSRRDVWLSRVGWRVASILFGQEVAPPSTPFFLEIYCLGDIPLNIHSECLAAVGVIQPNIHSECLAAVVSNLSVRFIWSPPVMVSSGAAYLLRLNRTAHRHWCQKEECPRKFILHDMSAEVKGSFVSFFVCSFISCANMWMVFAARLRRVFSRDFWVHPL